MTDTALVVSERAAINPYHSRDDVRELTDRLLRMHPAADEVGESAMRAAAQLALMLGANPLPGVNEMHVWKDNKGRNCMSLGINFWRRKAEEWGGVLYEVRPRLMRQNEAVDYGVPQGVTAAICKGVRAADMERYTRMGFTVNQIWDMCGRTGVGTSTANEYAKQGRPPSWTALKRAETDMLKQLFPAQFGAVERQMVDSDGVAVTVVHGEGDVIDGVIDEAEPEQEKPRYTLADANRDLFGTDNSPFIPAPKPAAASEPEPGPLPDDELTIRETDGRAFVATAAALLETDTETLKARMRALGYAAIPGKADERVAVYRRLRDDIGTPEQELLFSEPAAVAAGSEYRD